MCGNRRHLSFFAPTLHCLGQTPQRFHGDLDATVNATLQVDCTGAGRNITDTLGKDRVSENRGHTGAVTDGIAGALGGLTNHLGAKILAGILELDLFGDGDAVIADQGYTEALLNENTLGFGTERDPYGIGQCLSTSKQFLPSLRLEMKFLVHR